MVAYARRISLIFTIMNSRLLVQKTYLIQDASDATCLYLPLIVTQCRSIYTSVKSSLGFPSLADDYVEKSLDLNELLIKRLAATFFVRVEGDSMLDAGIHPDDILVVDRSLSPDAGKIVGCAL